MTDDELAARLAETYSIARESEAGVTVAMCLFGLEHAEAILRCGIPIHRLCKMADIPSLGPAINLGVNLSPYVTVTENLYQSSRS